MATFQVWLDGEAEEERTTVREESFRDAALGFASDTDDDLRIAKGRSQVLNIMDCTGRIERWEISGVLVPEYEAKCLGAWGRRG